MPAIISYDHPSLVLGNIVDPRILDLINKAASLQSKIDLAREKMNSYVMMKRSLAMTINELTDMNVDVSDLKTKVKDLDASITTAATDYMNVRIESETSMQQFRLQLLDLESGSSAESPVDFSNSVIKRLPLASESMQLDVQYFSFGSNMEDDVIANVEKYVRESTGNLGSRSDDMAKAASAQLGRQKQNHNLAGTLIITASCLHRNVTLLEPCVLDIDKAIAAWNNSPVGSTDKINTGDLQEVNKQMEEGSGTQDEKYMSILSGAAYGSGFVGMVHIVKTDTADTGPSDEVITQLKQKLAIGGWLGDAAGGFGVDEGVLEDVKKMLSTQSVSSHVSAIVMGAVPSIASSQLKSGVKKLLQPDPDVVKSTLTVMESSPDSTTVSVDSMAGAARNGNRLLNMQSATMRNVLRGLGEIDHGSNKVLDVNSLMSAFENYIQCIRDKDGSAGIPVKFYIKHLTKKQLLEQWAAKYYPAMNGTNDKPATDSVTPKP